WTCRRWRWSCCRGGSGRWFSCWRGRCRYRWNQLIRFVWAGAVRSTVERWRFIHPEYVDMNLGPVLRIGAALALALSLGGAHAASTLAEVERAIVPVASWGGTPADDAKARRHQITHITLHHQGEPFKPGTDPQAY